MRRPPTRVWVWTAATLVVAVVAVLLWRTSSVVATSSTTATPAAATSTTQLPAAALSPRWTAATTTDASGALLQRGRVLTTDATGLTLRDAVTGAPAWHYRRSDAHLCGATAVSDLVVAVFRTTGRCDEAVALQVGTGVRQWTRNVSYLADARLTSTAGLVLASTAGGVTTLDPTGDNTRWRHAADPGCRLVDAAAGSSGVVVLQRCPGSTDVQVQLLDAGAGTVSWTVPLAVGEGTPRLVGVDGLVDVLVGGTVHPLAPADGAQLPVLALPAPAGADEPLLQTAADDVVLLWARGTTYALDATTGVPRWQQPTAGLPAADAATGTTGELTDGAFVRRSIADGAELSRSTVTGAVPAGGRTLQAGATVLSATGDRVLALR